MPPGKTLPPALRLPVRRTFPLDLLPQPGQRDPADAESSARATSVRTKQPVPPTSRVELSESAQLGPAMSRWTQGVSPTNCWRNLAAVMAPPHLPPTFFRSAT